MVTYGNGLARIIGAIDYRVFPGPIIVLSCAATIPYSYFKTLYALII